MEELRNYISQFINLDAAETMILGELFQKETLAKMSFLASAGEYSRKIAFVQSGVLRAFYQKSTGEQYNKTFFTENNFVGAYSSLVSGGKNLIDIQCLTPCVLFTADYKSFTDLFDRLPKLERFARKLAEYFFVQKEKREIELVTLEAKDRYAIFLLEHPGLDQRIPQYHIASYLGITPTQLSRIRAQG